MDIEIGQRVRQGLVGAVLLLAVGQVAGTATADTHTTTSYTGPPLDIPNLRIPGGTAVPITVSGATGTITDVDVRFGGGPCSTDPNSTTVGLSTPRVRRLDVWITAPSGTYAHLMLRRVGTDGADSNLCLTRFDDEATVRWQDAESVGQPYSGSFRPSEPLSTLDGGLPNGLWTLNVYDHYETEADGHVDGDPLAGVLRSFSIDLTSGGAVTTVSYAGPPVVIPAPTPQPLVVPIVVSGADVEITDVDLRFDGSSCTPDLGATTVGLASGDLFDLDVRLTSPSGTIVSLLTPPAPEAWGSDGYNLCLTTFSDEALVPFVQAQNAPYSGTWQPASPLAAFDGEDPNGTWELSIADFGSSNGTLREFSLIVAAAGAPSSSTTVSPTTTVSPPATAVVEGQIPNTGVATATMRWVAALMLGTGIALVGVMRRPRPTEVERGRA